MVLVKILGALDLFSCFVFLMLNFGIPPYFQVVLFCAGLLFLKGLFVLRGEPLSIIDLFSSLVLLLSLGFHVSPILLWIPSFLLLAKGIVSFF